MNVDINKYFIPNTEATFVTNEGKICLEGINYRGNKRVPKAREQASLKPVPVEKVIQLINTFVNDLNGIETDYGSNSTICLDGIEHEIINNVICAKGCIWKLPIYSKTKQKYTFYDDKYDEIKKQFDLEYPNDIVWIKFTIDGFVGVVADSFDINFAYDNTSGELLHKLTPEKEWNSSFVIIIPVTKEMKVKWTRKQIETAIGEYLIGNEVPIIDYYSHNNFNEA